MAKKKKTKKLPKDLPEKFVERLKLIVGPSLFENVLKTFVDKSTTFRVNTLKTNRDEVKKTLVSDGFIIQQVPWYLDAFILQNKSKRELTDHPLYVEGKLYCQSLASMIPPIVLDPKAGEKVLDLTAAPGSKTSEIAALMGQKGELVANELNKVRFFRLKHNMEMLGVPDEMDEWTFTLRMEDGSALCLEYPEYFDKILVDAPCSGESRFIEGFPKTYGYWSEHKIKQVSYRQHKLLMAGFTALKPGGEMVYSTCTIAPEENEARISKLKERLGEKLEVMDIQVSGFKTLPSVLSWKGRDYHPDVKKTLRILPTRDIEGFFVAKLRKK